MVNVNKGPVDTRQDFNLVLKLLAQVMSFPQRGVCVHDDIDFNKVILKRTHQYKFIECLTPRIVTRTEYARVHSINTKKNGGISITGLSYSKKLNV